MLAGTMLWTALAAAGWTALAVGAPASAADRDGNDPRLDAAVHASWTNLPLRDWAERAGQLAGRPVVVDRAIDPGTPVTMNCVGEPLREILDRVAASAGGGVDLLQSSIRILPVARAGLAARAEQARETELARLPAPCRQALAARDAWAWPAGSRPRDLVASAARHSGLSLVGLDAVPHDHLPAGALPPLTLAERLDLVLADYGLRVEWARPEPGHGPATRPNGRIVALDSGLPPLAAAAAGRRSENAPVASGDRTTPGKVPGTGPGKGKPLATVDRRFTLRLQAPLEDALKAIAAQLGLELEIDRPALAARGIMAGEIVTAQVTNASRDELLDAVVDPVGLRWRIEGGRLLVEPKPAASPGEPE